MSLLLGAAAVQRGDSLLIFLFATALAWIVVSGVVSGAMLMGVTVRRVTPSRMRVGEQSAIRYHIRSGSLPLFAVTIREGQVDGALRGDGARVAHCARSDEVVPTAAVVPLRRGACALSRVQCVTSFPFGIMRKSVTFEAAESVLVHPRIEAIDHAAFLRLFGQGSGAARPKSVVGWGDELHGLREFRSGDSMRSVAWKRSLALDHLLVVERASMAARRLRLRVELRHEADGSTGDLEDAITLAASLLAHAEACAWAYALEVDAATHTVVSMHSGRWHLTRCLDELACAAPSQGESAGSRCSASARRTGGYSFVVTNRRRAGGVGELGPEALAALRCREAIA
jgi:uncharacterized protein (DUF58 family)